MYLKIYVCSYACICVTTIKKEAPNLKEYGGVRGRIWRKERDGLNDVIILS